MDSPFGQTAPGQGSASTDQHRAEAREDPAVVEQLHALFQRAPGPLPERAVRALQGCLDFDVGSRGVLLDGFTGGRVRDGIKSHMFSCWLVMTWKMAGISRLNV